jgi:hypothetical protein
MSEFEIKKASREAVKPLIALYSESGCGKTYSALLLARGFVGPAGKIVMIDTESGRGSLYADVLPGGYEVIQMDSPFSPARCIEAVEAVERSGASIGIIDSASHFWEGIGGVLDVAAQNEEKSHKAGLHNWRQPKMEHAKMMLKMMQSSIPWIICLRAKFKTRQTKDKDNKTVIIKDDLPSAIQAEDFLFEMTAHALIFPDHTIDCTKWSHPELKKCFPAKGEGPITSRHGELLAAWCQGKPAAAPTTAQAEPAATDPRALKKELWKLLAPVRGEASTWDGAEGWLLAKEILKDGQSIGKLTVPELLTIISAAQKILNPTSP